MSHKYFTKRSCAHCDDKHDANPIGSAVHMEGLEPRLMLSGDTLDFGVVIGRSMDSFVGSDAVERDYSVSIEGDLTGVDDVSFLMPWRSWWVLSDHIPVDWSGEYFEGNYYGSGLERWYSAELNGPGSRVELSLDFLQDSELVDGYWDALDTGGVYVVVDFADGSQWTTWEDLSSVPVPNEFPEVSSPMGYDTHVFITPTISWEPWATPNVPIGGGSDAVVVIDIEDFDGADVGEEARLSENATSWTSYALPADATYSMDVEFRIEESTHAEDGTWVYKYSRNSTVVPFATLAPSTTPDYSVDSIEIFDFSGNSGEYVSAFVQRSQTDACSEAPVIAVLSTDQVFGNADDIVVLTGNAESPVTGSESEWIAVDIPRHTPSGQYYIGAVIDPDNIIAESDETNNVAWSEALQVTRVGSIDYVMVKRGATFNEPGVEDDGYLYAIYLTGDYLNSLQAVTPWGEAFDSSAYLPIDWSGEYVFTEVDGFSFEAYADEEGVVMEARWNDLTSGQVASLDMADTQLNVTYENGSWAGSVSLASSPLPAETPVILSPEIWDGKASVRPVFEWEPWQNPEYRGRIFVEVTDPVTGESICTDFLYSWETSWTPPVQLEFGKSYEFEAVFTYTDPMDSNGVTVVPSPGVRSVVDFTTCDSHIQSVDLYKGRDYEAPNRPDDFYEYGVDITGFGLTDIEIVTPWGEYLDVGTMVPADWDGMSYIEGTQGMAEFEAWGDDGLMGFEICWDYLSESQYASLDSGTTQLLVVAGDESWSTTLDFAGLVNDIPEPLPTSPLHRAMLADGNLTVQWPQWVNAPTGAFIEVCLDEDMSPWQLIDSHDEQDATLSASDTSWTPQALPASEGYYQIELSFIDSVYSTIDGVTVGTYSYAENDVSFQVGGVATTAEVDPWTGVTYFLTPYGSFDDCQAFAELYGGSLVKLTGPAQEQWIQDTYGTDHQFWIGLTETAEGDWVWPDGTLATYTNWAAGEPYDWHDGGHVMTNNWSSATGESDSWTEAYNDEWARGLAMLAPGMTFADDHGNSAAEATAVTVGDGVGGFLGDYIDIDFFSFDAVAGQGYEIIGYSGNVPAGDTTLWLYDTDGKTHLVWDDDGAGDWHGRIRWVAPTDGTYYIAVDNYELPGECDDMGDYWIDIQHADIDVDPPMATMDDVGIYMEFNGTVGVVVDEPGYVGAIEEPEGVFLKVVDLADPLQPVETMSVFVRGIAGMAFGPHGYLYYVTDFNAWPEDGDEPGFSELVALDISAPGEVVEVYRHTLGNIDADSLTVEGDFAFVGTQSDDYQAACLEIYDLSNPASASWTGGALTIDGPGEDFDPERIIVDNGLAYMLAETGPTVSIIDVSDLGSPELVGQYVYPETRWASWDIALANGVLWIGAEFELLGVDVTDPTSPSLISTLALDGHADQLAAYGDVLVVGQTSYGPGFVDVSDPSRPVMFESLELPGASGCVAVVGDYVYASAMGSVAIYEQEFPVEATVVHRQVFYNNSALDGNDPFASSQDDDAIATDKQVLMAGQTPTQMNVTGYSKGINGIMIDVDNLADADAISVADFEFRVGSADDPAGMAAAPDPIEIAVRSGDGVDGSDRITIVWDDQSITNQWLEVTMKATDATGLETDDVFSIGNLVADANGDGAVNLDDFVVLKSNFGSAGRGVGLGDFNASGAVDLDDFVLLKSNFGQSIAMAAPALNLLAEMTVEPVSEEPAAPAPMIRPAVFQSRRGRLGLEMVQRMATKRTDHFSPVGTNFDPLAVRPVRLNF